MPKKITALLFLLTPVAAFALYKPVRVLAPELFAAVHCIDEQICIEEPSRLDEARAIYDASLRFVADTVGPFQKSPRVIFCSSKDCQNAFGFDKAAATNVGKSGIVVAPRGWKPHYLRHEMIHHRQAEELGILAAFTKPEWLVEGMAYALSDDPRATLADRWEETRQRFLKWYEIVGRDRLWSAAKAL